MEAPEKKVCRKCGVEKPLSQFRRSPKTPDGYTHVCCTCLKFSNKAAKEMLGIGPRMPKGSNPALAQFTPRELLEELKSRGYRGELQFTYTIKI